MNRQKDALECIKVSAGIICRHGLLLAGQRADDKPYAGYWELPGGKCEGNETAEEALCREMAEELGISVKECRLLEVVDHSYPELGYRALVHFFQVISFSGEPFANESQNLRWISLEEIGEFDFLPADAQLLAALARKGFCS